MKIKYFRKLKTKVSGVPTALILTVLIAGGAGLYFYGYQYFLKGFYGPYIGNLASEKKLAIDAWFERRMDELEETARHGAIRDNPLIMAGGTDDAPGKAVTKSRRSRRALDEAQHKTSELLSEEAASGRFRMFTVLSPDGKVISSYKREMEGEDWSDRDFFRNNTASTLKAPAPAGFYNYEGREYGLEFLVPVTGAGNGPGAVIYSVADIKELEVLLRIAGGLYRTEKVEIIDKTGNVLLTRDGVPGRKTRYNIPEAGGGALRSKDGLFFYVSALEHAPFRLIYTASKSEVDRLPVIVLILYCSIGGLIILIMLIQNASFSKLVARPVSKLTSAVKLAAVNEKDIEWGKDYTGELSELRKELEALAEASAGKVKTSAADAGPGRKNRLTAAYLDKIADEVGSSLDSVSVNIGRLVRDGNIPEKEGGALATAMENARDFWWLMDELTDISELEQGGRAVLPEEFDVCELAREVGDIARGLAAGKEIELVIDCNGTFRDKPVSADRQRLKRVLVRLASHAVRSTDVGTVTILVSGELRDGIEYLEVSVADTGRGIAPEMLEQAADELSVPLSFLWFVVVKKLTDAIGGRIGIENAEGKGSVFTISIPIRARIY